MKKCLELRKYSAGFIPKRTAKRRRAVMCELAKLACLVLDLIDEWVQDAFEQQKPGSNVPSKFVIFTRDDVTCVTVSAAD